MKDIDLSKFTLLPAETKSLEQWEKIYVKLRAGNYRLWQMQYAFNLPEGFHAWFAATGKTDIEVVTFSKKVQDAIIKYR